MEKLKSSNENGEPGIEKKNVKFLFGLLEQVSIMKFIFSLFLLMILELSFSHTIGF